MQKPGNVKIGQKDDRGLRWYRFRVVVGYKPGWETSKATSWECLYVETAGTNEDDARDALERMLRGNPFIGADTKAYLVDEDDRHYNA